MTEQGTSGGVAGIVLNKNAKTLMTNVRQRVLTNFGALLQQQASDISETSKGVE